MLAIRTDQSLISDTFHSAVDERVRDAGDQDAPGQSASTGRDISSSHKRLSDL